MGVADASGTGPFAALIVTVSPSEFMPDSTPIIPAQPMLAKGWARLRPAEGHDLVAGEVVAHIEIEVAPDDRLPVVARTAPCRERTASHEHVLAHGVPMSCAAW